MKYLILLFFALPLFFIHWTLVLVVPLAILNGYINSRAISKNKVGKKYHTIQLLIFVSLAATLVATKVILWDEIILVVALYYAAFETSLNLFNGKSYSYVGETAWMDRTVRGWFPKIWQQRWFFVVSKLFLFFIGLAIYYTL